MKTIISIALFLVIVAVAVVGLLFIFDIISVEYASELMVKWVAAVVLLGGCVAAGKLLFNSMRDDGRSSSD